MDFLKLLFDKLDGLHITSANKRQEEQVPRPLFKVWCRLPVVAACSVPCHWSFPVTRSAVGQPLAILHALLQLVMLYVDEATSIKRQMARGEFASLHNKRAMDAGSADLR